MFVQPHSPVHRLHGATGATSGFDLSERDSRILDFLWRWKLAPTATIHAACSGENSPYATYQALLRLQKLKYVVSEKNERYRFWSWSLTKKGFRAIREVLGPLREAGFRSENPWHDFNVVAFHLGDWLIEPVPQQVELFTEQEIRRKRPEDHPSWVPTLHRPDGFTRIRGGDGRPMVIAYEVELSEKSVSRYETLIRDYRCDSHVDLVFWLIGSPGVRSQIQKAVEKSRDTLDNFQQFVEYDDFIKSGWGAPTTNTRLHPHASIRETTREILGISQGSDLAFAKNNSWGSTFYDHRKVIGRTR